MRRGIIFPVLCAAASRDPDLGRDATP